jgi:hypothetical protein
VAAAAVHDVRNLRVFGSVARGEDRADRPPFASASNLSW